MATASFVMGKPIMTKYLPATNYAAGDVVVIGDQLFVAHEDNPLFGGTTPVIVDALAVGGGIYQVQADGAIPVGAKVFWNATALQVTQNPGTNAFFGVLVGGPNAPIKSDPGPATAGDNCLVLHYSSAVAPSPILRPYIITAAGAAQANAANLNYGFNLVNGADGTKAVILPVAYPGKTLVVKNNAASALPVFPQVGGTVNGVAANSNYLMAANSTTAMFIANTNANNWHTLPFTAS